VRYEPPSPLLRRATAIVATALLALAAYLVWRLRRDEPVGYRDPVEHFKYGSTGGERESGIPLSIWTLLPELFPEHLPERNRDFGFVYEPGRELPIGVSQRNVQGIERVFFNCAICHVGTYRLEADAERVIVPGMPSNTVDLQAFERFLFDCAADEGFTPERIVLALEQRGSEDWLNRKLLRYLGVSLMRERLLLIRDRFAFMDQQPHYGPGRVDTFNPPKVLLNFPMEKLSARERIGTCDLPSIWLQLPREGLQLHWDGNNSSVEERNRSAAFGTGAMPATLDREGMERLADWLRTDREHVPPQLSKERVNAPPLYPQERIDPTRSAAGKPLYERHCAECHGRSGTDFRHDKVGEVTKIGDVGTDPWRLDSYTYDLCVNQNLLYAGYPDERFRHFTKTNGYANQPLDGIWLRAPYLHNGSVPTLLDLLAPPDERPKVFYRGYDVIDHERVGFVSDRGRVEAASRREGREYFLFETEFDGNGNRGHEYGTRLTLEEKRAIVEYLKTF
jgi:hypothetical protein